LSWQAEPAHFNSAALRASESDRGDMRNDC
jgi:hypothetical protein